MNNYSHHLPTYSLKGYLYSEYLFPPFVPVGIQATLMPPVDQHREWNQYICYNLISSFRGILSCMLFFSQFKNVQFISYNT